MQRYSINIAAIYGQEIWTEEGAVPETYFITFC